ncbi:MAG: type II secretion system GspH family protein [Cystobacterineae bacterium]|nr:type II secretion system GspH family protein [Cystobacterineae bacterium]
MRFWHDKRLVFSRHRDSRFDKGITLLEVLVSAALLMLGIFVAMGLSNVVNKNERNYHLSLTANKVAQHLLETVVSENCLLNPTTQVCQNLTDRSGIPFSLWVTPEGEIQYTNPPNEDNGIEFEARFDVQTTNGCLSGTSLVNCVANLGTNNNTEAWALDRNLIGEAPGNLHNVRITVSYVDPFNRSIRFTSYQTRMVP